MPSPDRWSDLWSADGGKPTRRRRPVPRKAAPRNWSLQSLPGPGYSPDKALEMVPTRYERLPPLLRHTLPRLLADARIRGLFAELRGEPAREARRSVSRCRGRDSESARRRCGRVRHVDDAPWGLEVHQPAVDHGAVLKVLSDRYGYWTEDVDHDDFFPGE
jgi:hypothetical protein